MAPEQLGGTVLVLQFLHVIHRPVANLLAVRRTALASPCDTRKPADVGAGSLRHGLTAKTVIDALEDAEDYAAFEMTVTADYEAQSAVERELVLRLASLLWRLRRATTIESGLFKIQAKHLLQFSPTPADPSNAPKIIESIISLQTEAKSR